VYQSLQLHWQSKLCPLFDKLAAPAARFQALPIARMWGDILPLRKRRHLHTLSSTHWFTDRPAPRAGATLAKVAAARKLQRMRTKKDLLRM
jgi:hypothetical protein